MFKIKLFPCFAGFLIRKAGSMAPSVNLYLAKNAAFLSKLVNLFVSYMYIFWQQLRECNIF